MIRTYLLQLSMALRHRFGRLLGRVNENFPENVLITAPHASYRVPLSHYNKLSLSYKLHPRLLMNFSDFGTRFLIENVPENQKVEAKFSRLLGDPNRQENADDVLRFVDFGGEEIFTKRFKKRLTQSWFRRFWIRKVMKRSYRPFYTELDKKLDKMMAEMGNLEEKNQNQDLIVIDLHDTGNWLLGSKKRKDRKRPEAKKMPKVVISNAPDLRISENRYGTATMAQIRSLKEQIIKQFGYSEDDVKINEPFLGGNVIRHIARSPKVRKWETKTGKRVICVQLEFNRSLYMNERSQTPSRANIGWVRQGLVAVCRALAEGRDEKAQEKRETN